MAASLDKSPLGLWGGRMRHDAIATDMECCMMKILIDLDKYAGKMRVPRFGLKYGCVGEVVGCRFNLCELGASTHGE